MRYIAVIVCGLFVFLGMYIGKRWELKYFSINSIFGLFVANGLYSLLISCDLLSRNYHDMTLVYVFLSMVIGFILMIIVSDKNDNIDDISIICFSILNSYLLLLGNFSVISFIINILYYVLIGIYVRNSRSYISVFIGIIIGIFLSFISGWLLGYLFSLVVGVFVYFLYSIYSVVAYSRNRNAIIGLIVGLLIGVIGAL